MSPLPEGALLLLAATRWEACPLARRLRLKSVASGRFEGIVSDRGVVLVQTGVGPRRAAAALSAIKPVAPGFVLAVSTGYAGALRSKFRPGDVVADLPASAEDMALQARAAAAQAGLDIHFERIAHSDRVLGRPEDKRGLSERENAGAVDMETAALRDWARPYGIPVLAARAIIDAADEFLPEQAPGDGDGRALFDYALRHPSQLPAMALMGLRQWRIMPRYSLFLAKLLSATAQARTASVEIN
ncbi:MAG TPA: hypothetical protein DEB40_13385 [Elusimicrobia bacterium]|nr:hypothetical protein [Elusimicrobiota bacterium]HBT62727.1 hypothetical protein [Elusimicrobiota bacterium]